MKKSYLEKVSEDKMKFEKREQDWRNGAIVYQVFVDRFSPSNEIDKKIDLYQSPKTLKKWDEIPQPGPFLKDIKYCQHELEYWGGDLKSVQDKLDYIKDLNVDVLYLNPIHKSLSNHKYDASDYMEISPEYGTFEDLKNLSDKVHESNMKIMLDGVFNHLGVTSKLFTDAQNETSPTHNWFDFNKKYPEGVRLWADVKSLPELNLENEAVKDYIYRGEHSVIRKYLKFGTDGWRLDVAFDIGYQVLSEITQAAHDELPGSMVVGEIWNYPKDWLLVIDGVMNFTFRELIKRSLLGSISPKQTMNMLNKIIEDTGIEGIMKSWNVLDNHDTPRLVNMFPNNKNLKLAQIMQFTLPGSPNLYYGTELGMDGADDPMNRAPMRWDLVSDDNLTLQWTKKLIQLHNQERALRIGDFLPILSEKTIAFERLTQKVGETVITVINPSNDVVVEDILIPDSKLMNYSKFDVLLGEEQECTFMAGFLHIKLNPKSFVIIKPRTKVEKSYTPYKRV